MESTYLSPTRMLLFAVIFVGFYLLYNYQQSKIEGEPCEYLTFVENGQIANIGEAIVTIEGIYRYDIPRDQLTDTPSLGDVYQVEAQIIQSGSCRPLYVSKLTKLQ